MIRQSARLSDIKDAHAAAHGKPKPAGQRELNKEAVVKELAAPLPEVFVVAQQRVFGRKTIRKLTRQPLLGAVARPARPLGGVFVELLVDSWVCGFSTVLADKAFVGICNVHPSYLSDTERQSALVVNSVGIAANTCGKQWGVQ
ncbi:hypothetical protein I540_0282 [Mycobacteroides abscessus subsp. bolletii 1513]|uniref:Uncharacterized protein n=1 Tax=Mycobacteroides abscessus subsp. bolletii 1513 TaxID=1299321 RepID=X8E330_9MYCO|nr:hypothetical protein I540_0282 [Mycobacteroides abscessus subsp. bolletii 1513]